MNSKNVFVYGTLLSKYLDPQEGEIKKHSRSEILKGFKFERALLNNYKLLWPDGLGFPFIIPFEGCSVKGEVYYAVGDDIIGVLDEIEGVAGGLYEKKIVKVTTDSGEKAEALTYVGGESLQRHRNSSSYFTVIPEEFET